MLKRSPLLAMKHGGRDWKSSSKTRIEVKRRQHGYYLKYDAGDFDTSLTDLEERRERFPIVLADCPWLAGHNSSPGLRGAADTHYQLLRSEQNFYESARAARSPPLTPRCSCGIPVLSGR